MAGREKKKKQLTLAWAPMRIKEKRSGSVRGNGRGRNANPTEKVVRGGSESAGWTRRRKAASTLRQPE